MQWSSLRKAPYKKIKANYYQAIMNRDRYWRKDDHCRPNAKAFKFDKMTVKEFLSKYPLDLSPEERQLCADAISRMEKAKDVHHGITHIYSSLGCLDEFIQTQDFQSINPRPDLKVIFLTILCHDCWRAGKDPQGPLALLWYTIGENFGNPRIFAKMANEHKIDPVLAAKVNYCIKKDGLFVVFPLKTPEAKIHKAIDEWDQFNETRIRVIEKKFLLDRPLKRYYVRQAKLAMKLFVELDNASAHYFPWIARKIEERKKIIIPRLWAEIGEYERLLELKEKGDVDAFEASLKVFKAKVLNN